MSKRTRIVLICILSALVLLVGAYCGLRFGLGIDILNRSGWDTHNGAVVYRNYYGLRLRQWQQLDSNTYYFHPETGARFTDWQEIEGSWYYFGKDGAMHTGWLEEQGHRYYFDGDGRLYTGWLELDGSRYYLDENGAALSGWQVIGNQRYYLDNLGKITPGWLEQEEGTYYIDHTGSAVSGWLRIDGSRYYLDENGLLQTGWLNLENKTYYLDETGKMHTGWLEDGQDRYYFHPDGTMAIGQVEIDGVNRFFTSKGKHVILVNRWNLMPDDYTMELVDLFGFQVDISCRDALEQMILDCRAVGYSCYINNTYRSKETQQYMWDVRLKQRQAEGMTYDEAVEYTARSLAFVGASEHHLGLAVDINGSDGMYEWLGENCWNYGFILRYPPDSFDITGIIYEPWHFRYVGLELATELQGLGLCMETYMQQLTESQS